MRTTLIFDDDLYREAKKAARECGLSLPVFVEKALRETLARRGRRPLPRRLPVFGGGKLRPGVDLNDSAGLLDLMEKRHPPFRRKRLSSTQS
jgi:hypothetical protein